MAMLTSVRADLARREALRPRAPRDPLIERARLCMGTARAQWRAVEYCGSAQQASYVTLSFEHHRG